MLPGSKGGTPAARGAYQENEMVSSSEKRRLLEQYREPLNARAVLAKAVAGLAIIFGIAMIGLTAPVDGDTRAELKMKQAASGR
jgi:hypothetical protein